MVSLLFRFPFVFPLLFFLLFGPLAACPPHPSPPDGGPPSDVSAPDIRCFSGKSEAPRITSISFLGAVPGQARLLRFLAQWQDLDQDLGAGQILSWAEGKAFPPQAFPPFSPSIRGEIRVYVDLAGFSLPSQKEIAVEFQLVDASGNASNRVLLVLQVSR